MAAKPEIHPHQPAKGKHVTRLRVLRNGALAARNGVSEASSAEIGAGLAAVDARFG